MIFYIQGEVLEVGSYSNQMHIVVLIGGVGYGVYVPSGDIYEVGDKVSLYTSFQVREDSQNLFGFLKKEQKEMFEDILNVSGVGPKVSLSLVSMFSQKEFSKILLKGDYKSLSKVKGLGQKGAKKIVLELQGIYVADEQEVSSEVLDELKIALDSLGFKGSEKEKLVKKAQGYIKKDSNVSIENLLSFVLQRGND